MMTVNRRTTTVLAIIVIILIAVFAITRWQRSVATRKLLADLPTSDYAKVLDAKTQLKERGASIVPALLDGEHLGSSDSAPARWRSAELLGEVGNKSAIQPLEQALSDDSPDVRATAAMALAKLNAKGSAAAIANLLSDAEEETQVKIAAATALGLLKHVEAIPAMSELLGDTVEALEAKAWTAYSAWKTATEAITSAEEAAALPDADPVASAEAIATAKEAVPDALEARQEAEKLVSAAGGRMPATFDIEVPEGEEPDPDFAPPKDTKWQLRRACAIAIGLTGGADGVGALTTALDADKEPSAEVRTAAAYALADIACAGSSQATDGLVTAMLAALEDETADVRAAAIHSMGALKDKSAKDRLASALQQSLNDDSYWAREAAKSSMKRLGIPVPANG